MNAQVSGSDSATTVTQVNNNIVVIVIVIVIILFILPSSFASEIGDRDQDRAVAAVVGADCR